MLSSARSGSRRVARLNVHFAVDVSGGSGAFEGLIGACGQGKCDFSAAVRLPVRRPKDLNRSRVAQSSPADASRMSLELEPGNPAVKVSEPPYKTFLWNRALRASARPNSYCTANVETAPGVVIQLGPVLSDRAGLVEFPVRDLRNHDDHLAGKQYRLTLRCERTVKGSHFFSSASVSFPAPGERCRILAPKVDCVTAI